MDRLSLTLVLLLGGCIEASQGLSPGETEEPPPGADGLPGYPEDTALIDVHPASRSLLLLVDGTRLVWLDIGTGEETTLNRQIRWNGNQRRRAAFAAGGAAALYRVRDRLDEEPTGPLIVHYPDGETRQLDPPLSPTPNLFADAPRPGRLAYQLSDLRVAVFDVARRSEQIFDSVFGLSVDVFEDRALRSLQGGPNGSLFFVEGGYVSRADGRFVARTIEGDVPLPELDAFEGLRGDPPAADDRVWCGAARNGSLVRVDLETLAVDVLEGSFVDATPQGPWCLGFGEDEEGLFLEKFGSEGSVRTRLPGPSYSGCQPMRRLGGPHVLFACDVAIVDGVALDLPVRRVFRGVPNDTDLASEEVGRSGFGLFLGQAEGVDGLSVWRWKPDTGLERTDRPEAGSACGFELVPTVDPDFILARSSNGRPRYEQRTFFLSRAGRYLRCASSEPGHVQLWLEGGIDGASRPLGDEPIRSEVPGFAFSDRVLFHDEMTVVLAEGDEDRLELRVFEHP